MCSWEVGHRKQQHALPMHVVGLHALLLWHKGQHQHVDHTHLPNGTPIQYTWTRTNTTTSREKKNWTKWKKTAMGCIQITHLLLRDFRSFFSPLLWRFLLFATTAASLSYETDWLNPRPHHKARVWLAILLSYTCASSPVGWNTRSNGMLK